jgi:hypothetical protein
MKQKKSITKRQKSKFDEDCYDASSFEETYEDTIVSDDRDDSNEEIEEDSLEITVEVADSTKPKKRGPKPNKSQFYVEPKEFDTSIIEFYNTGHITDELATMVSKIAHKLSYAPNFINYTYRDEMVGDAIVRMMKALIAKKYTHKKGSNPFSYFTKIAFNAFRNRIKREKYAHDTLQKYQEEIIMNSDYMSSTKNSRTSNYHEDSTILEE